MPSYTCRASFKSHATTDGTLIVNVLHFTAAQLTSPADPQQWATDLAAHLTTLYRAVLSTGETFDNITTNTVAEPAVDPGEGVAVVNAAGTRAPTDTKLSNSIGVLHSLKTATPKRYARGHIFMPPVLSSTEVGSGWVWSGVGGYLPATRAFTASCIAGWTAGDITYQLAVHSRTQLARGLTPFTFPVLAYYESSRPHVLRSRMTSP